MTGICHHCSGLANKVHARTCSIQNKFRGISEGLQSRESGPTPLGGFSVRIFSFDNAWSYQEAIWKTPIILIDADEFIRFKKAHTISTQTQ